MSELFSFNRLKYNKIWLTKDKYIFRTTLGDHWYLKKFIVLYNALLVHRNEISIDDLKEIAKSFSDFIKCYGDQQIRKDAENFFFNPIDLRNAKSVLSFQKFNDVKENDDAARKYYFVYLMGIGMQSGIKKAIGDLLYSSKNVTISKILDEIPRIQKEEIKRKKQQGKIPRSVYDTTETIFSDFHAEIRNYRQLLSYFGILPPEEDGYELNEISKLICEADPKLLMSIWEHQKIKMRFSNPYTRSVVDEDPSTKYTKLTDFEDFEVNPYLAMVELIYLLYEKKPSDAYITFEDYKYFICREAPYDADIVLNKILAFRQLNREDKEKINKTFDMRPKSREFSKDKPKSKSEDFFKELSNQIYGIFEYDYVKSKSYYVPLLKYDDGKLLIIDDDLFCKFAKFLINIKQYIKKHYSAAYDEISAYCSLKMMDEVAHCAPNERYIKKLSIIRLELLRRCKVNPRDFYERTLNSWKDYISYIDFTLLIYCYAALIGIKYAKENPGESPKNKEELKFSLNQAFIDIAGIERSQLEDILFEIIQCFCNEDGAFLKISDEIILNETAENIQIVERELEKELQKNSYSILKKKISKEENDLLYEVREGKRIRKRNNKMMLLVEKQRMKNKLIMDETRPFYPIDKCDCCNNHFSKGEPECHHMIPFEIYGPDSIYNYAFLCSACHKNFTHSTLASQREHAITQLKIKGIVKREYFERMVQEGSLTLGHLNFLHRDKYVHIVDKLEMIKVIKNLDANYLKKIDEFIKKTLPSKERWTRAMRTVYAHRKRFHLVMERVRLDFPVDNCDGCNQRVSSADIECHHIIPKKIKGPESPFNYAYLCKICHSKITYNLKGKEEVIVSLKDKELVNKRTICQMLIWNEILPVHLDYLVNENYLSKMDHNELELISNKMKEYQCISK